jgi:putative ABC transport system ATP-binding protein
VSDDEKDDDKVEEKSEAKDEKKAEKKNGKAIIRLKGVDKSFFRGKERLDVLQNLDLDVPTGSFEALMGPSGSGKTTLLNLIAGLDRPSNGVVEVAGEDLAKLGDSALSRWRSRHIGFIFQHFNLIPVLTALENVELPLLLTKLSGPDRKKRAATALRVVGLEDRADHRPDQLSGGQEQRVGIARAIVHDPSIIVADEPTGELDRSSADEILALLEKLNQEFNKTIVMVTHDPNAAKRATIIRNLDKGALLS